MTSKPRFSFLYADGKPTTFGWVMVGGLVAGILEVIALAVVVFGVSVPLPDAAPGGRATEVLDARAS